MHTIEMVESQQETQLNYLQALEILHERLQPSTYVEIGCRQGISLSLSRCSAIGIDPDFEITSALHSPTRLFNETSDYFFGNRDLGRLLGGAFDLAFIDGMHNAEYALRDFINLERFAGPTSIIVIDDVLPQHISWTTRERHSNAWTGDIYKLIPLLRENRPDLHIDVFDVEMKGLAIVQNLSPDNSQLAIEYKSLEKYLLSDASEMISVEQIRQALQPRNTDLFEQFVIQLSKCSVY